MGRWPPPKIRRGCHGSTDRLEDLGIQIKLKDGAIVSPGLVEKILDAASAKARKLSASDKILFNQLVDWYNEQDHHSYSAPPPRFGGSEHPHGFTFQKIPKFLTAPPL